MHLTARHTVWASYLGYLTEAITINFAPLLFVTFEKDYKISMGSIALLIGISFLTQLVADIIFANVSDKINTRATVVGAHLCASIGMSALSYLPDILPSPFVGIVVAVMIASFGGGTIEVFISPIVEATPLKSKNTAMSLLHSFYSWGIAATVLFSTLFFKIIGIEHWRILALLWSIIPLIGALIFCLVPIYELKPINSDITSDRYSKYKLFPIFAIMMFCAGAAQQAIAQWASSFTETELGISKEWGDMLGSFSFAVLMGISRVLYGKLGNKIKLTSMLIFSSALCIFSYLIAAISQVPILSLVGIALCGLSMGIMWPGTYSIAAEQIPRNGVKMYALLALFGDIGCITGPTAVGVIADIFENDLRIAILLSTIFPIILVITSCIGFNKTKNGREGKNNGTQRTEKRDRRDRPRAR